MVDARHRRAVAVIALSVVALAVAGGVYLAPSLQRILPAAPAAATPPFVTAPGESVSFTFLTSTRGWAAATLQTDSLVRVYATTDGARSWRLEGVIGLPDYPEHADIRFFDARHGVVTTSMQTGALVYRTADGGKTWSTVDLEPATWSVVFVDANEGWSTSFNVGTGARYLYRTQDGGGHWAALPNLPGYGYPQFVSPREGWLGGDLSTGTVYSTQTGGETWNTWQLPPPPPCTPFGKSCLYGASETGNTLQGFVSVSAIAGGAAVATDDNGAEFVTLDGGASWRFIEPPPALGGYGDISFEDPTRWWVVRGTNLYKTSDAGATWKLISDRIEYDSLKPTIVDSKHAWAMVQAASDTQVGQRPNLGWSLEVTSDGGLTWKDAAVPVPT